MARAQISGRQAGNGSNTSSNTASRSSSMTNLASEAEFPSMAAANGAPTVAGRWAATSAPHHQKKVSGNAIDDFPALAGGSRPSNPSASRSLAAVIGKKGQTRLVNAAPSNHGNGAAFRPGEAFPALAPSAARTHDPKQAPMSSSLRRAIDSLAQKLKKRLGLSVYKDFKETTELWTAGSMTGNSTRKSSPSASSTWFPRLQRRAPTPSPAKSCWMSTRRSDSPRRRLRLGQELGAARGGRAVQVDTVAGRRRLELLGVHPSQFGAQQDVRGVRVAASH